MGAIRMRLLRCGIALLTCSWVPESTLLPSTFGVLGVYSARWLMDVHYSLVIQMLTNFRKSLRLWVRRISRIGQQLLNCQIGSQTSKSSRHSRGAALYQISKTKGLFDVEDAQISSRSEGAWTRSNGPPIFHRS